MPRHYQDNDRPTTSTVNGPIIYPTPIVPVNDRISAVNFMWEHYMKPLFRGRNFFLGFAKFEAGVFLTKVTWILILLFSIYLQPAQAQLPIMAGTVSEWNYTQDGDILCLYNRDHRYEQVFLLEPCETYWDDNGIIATNTPLFDPRREPAYMVRWVSFHYATDQVSGDIYFITIRYEWYNLWGPTITNLAITHRQPWE